MGIDINSLGPGAKRQILQKLGQQEREKTSKYHSTPTRRVAENGTAIEFDSQKEARRYDELLLMLKAGTIRDLKLQPQFTLQESYVTPEGVRVRAIRYVADFSYEIMRPYWKGYEAQCPPDGWYTVVEDVKSSATKTRVYALKKKLLMDRFGIEITEV